MVDRVVLPAFGGAAAAAGSSRGLFLPTVRGYVQELVPELSADQVEERLTARVGEPVLFRCPCFGLRHARDGGDCRTNWVAVTDKQKLTQHLKSKTHVACKYVYVTVFVIRLALFAIHC